MNVAFLQQQILELQAQLTLLQETSTATIIAQKAEIESLRTENKLLRGKLDAFIQRYFGKKSEALSEGQLELLLAGIDATPAPSVPEKAPLKKASRKRTGSTKVRTPENLEVVQVVLTPKEVQSEPGEWEEITQEVTRQLDYCQRRSENGVRLAV